MDIGLPNLVIAEHSLDLSLVPDAAKILDLGCRGFGFANYFRDRGHDVYAIDVDLLDGHRGDDALGDYLRCAVASEDGRCGVRYVSGDPQATHITYGDAVPMYTLQTLSAKLGVAAWDIIKMDIEGAEYEILDNARTCHPIAKQLTIEFHAHCAPQDKWMLDALLSKLSTHYEVHNQVWEPRHGCCANYWDVLLISR